MEYIICLLKPVFLILILNNARTKNDRIKYIIGVLKKGDK